MEKNSNAQIQYTSLMIAAEKGVVFFFYSRVPAALFQPKDYFPSSLGFRDCPLPSTLYIICSRVCSFGLSSHGVGHNGFLVPLCIFHFLYQTSQCPHRSLPVLSTNSVFLLLYPTVLCLLPGEIVLLKCQLL